MTSLANIGATAAGPLSIRPTTNFASGGDFSHAFQGAVSGAPATIVTGGRASGSTTSHHDEGDGATSVTAAPSALQTALANFLKEARKTPAERAHDQILAKHNLTEDEYKALPSDDKKLIDQEVLARTRLLMKDAGTGTASANAAVA